MSSETIGNSGEQGEVLRGVGAVRIHIDNNATVSKMADVGLDEDAVSAYVASRLSRVGLDVVPDAQAAADCPTLLVRLSFLTLAAPFAGGVAWSVDVHLMQRFDHSRLVGKPLMLPVWSYPNYGVAVAPAVASTIIGVCADMADAFASRWLAAQQQADAA